MRLLIAFLLLAALLPPAQASDTSETLFAQHRNSVFQIQLIDISANQKGVIGSGFAVGQDGLVATNYHVISDSVYETGRYRIEAVDDKNVHHTMTLRAVDVIHDLALVQFAEPDTALATRYPPLAISTADMAQGTPVFSIGNPLDIGMMIVGGDYNGLVKDSRFQRLIFSGDINGGMSGGPALNSQGQVVGVNVATQGKGIGYLVPARHLAELLASLPQQDPQQLEKVVGEQLLADQEQFYGAIMATPFKTQTFADLTLPGELHTSIKCWGESEQTRDRRYDASTMQCRNGNDDLFIKGNKYTGEVQYSYQWSQQLDLNRFQLYSLVEQQNSFGSTSFAEPDYSWSKDEVTPYQCKTSFVATGGGSWRMVYCVRAYKIFPGLYDMGLLMISADRNDRNLSAELTVTGISEKNAARLTEQFIRSVSWTR